MSSPHTRPAISQPLDYVAMADADNSSSVSQSNTWNINSPLPWLVLTAIMAGVSFGMSVMMYSEWREVKTKVALLDESNQRLKLYLEARGLTQEDIENGRRR